MTTAKKWGLPGLTGLMVLASIVLPQQLSSLRDLKILDTIHIEPLSEDDLSVRELPLPEKLALLARAIRDPDLEVYSTTQPLPLSGQPGADQAEAAFFQSVDCLADWGVLPQSFDPDTLEFQGGSRAVYVEADSGQSVSMLYLQGENDSRDNFWLVVDEETGLPVWVAPPGRTFSHPKNWERVFWRDWAYRPGSGAPPCGKWKPPAAWYTVR